MKAKHLASLLMEHPEFDVKLIINTSDCTPEHPWPNYQTLSVIGIGDVGYSDKVILLEVE